MISISHLTALDISPEDLIDNAAVAGFEGVGLRINPPKHTPDKWPVVGDKRRIADLRRRADDRNIQIFEAESFIMDADVDMAALKRALDVAAELGVSCLVSAGGDPDESRMVDNYAELGEAAAPYGIIVGMEFMAFRAMRSLVDATRVWRRVAHPNARILIDALHLDRSGGSPADVAKLDPAAIGYIQVCDAPTFKPGTDLVHEARTGRCYPGDGVLPLDALFDALPSGVPVSLEAPVSADDHLPYRERLKRAGDKTLGFFAKRRARSSVTQRA